MKWLPLARSPRYEISEYGDVRRLCDSGRYKAGDLLDQHNNGKGYLYVIITVEKGRHEKPYVHTLVCETFIGPRPSPLHETAHRDNRRSNNHFSNLRWATRSENQMDRHRHETMPGQRLYGARAWATIS